MLVKALPRLPWQLTVALFAMVATADIEAANSSTNIGSGVTTLLQDSAGKNLSDLVPVSQEAARKGLDGELFLTTDKTYGNISDQDIAFISCNDDDYKGNLEANSIFFDVMQNQNIRGAVLYSTATDYCNYTNPQPVLQSFPIFSMTKKSDSQSLFDQLNSQPASNKFFVKVVKSGNDSDSNQQNGSNGNNTTQQNPLGPSPSTAVAMIILYSITGIITALFLVIIVTGAVRAHRHPDRYGPRDVLGRPRQSRARGIGRAILDTLPIVKFGDKEPPKPTDVELGSTGETRDANRNEPGTETGVVNAQSGNEERRGSQAEEIQEAHNERDAGMESGIAAAQPVVAGSSASQNDPASEGLGCSICTDDFENGQDIRVLPCNHKFHPECVDPWLLNVSGTCPLCRVDLRPTTSRTSTEAAEGETPDLLAPPLQSSTEEVSHRRRSQFRDLLSFRSRPNASADERISALRRLREQRRNQSGDVTGGSANASTDDVRRDRRSKRMSARLSEVFSSRRRAGNGAEGSPPPVAESSSSTEPQSPRRAASPGPSGSNAEQPQSGSASGTDSNQPAQHTGQTS